MATMLFMLLTLLSHATSSLSQNCHPHDKSALLQIKKEFNNPTLLSSWKPNSDCCQDNWYGVVCDIDQHYRVTDILITKNREIRAQIPPSIGKLRYLKSLFFDELPNLTGPIPVQALSKLTKLDQITIKSSGLSGPIPYFPAQFKSLTWLELTSNNLTGPLPPSLSLLPKLNAIFLDNNKLTGSIPPSYSKFGGLVLSNNQLSGPLPKSFSSSKLFNLQLAHNKLEGDASMLFGSTKQTNVIDIAHNKFSFDLGKVKVSKDLPTLDVSHNQIYGKLPEGIENVLNLNVSYNLLCGEIPKRGNLQKFDVYVYIHNKCLCGSPLPSCK
ncbi:Leucine-rich repeat-containing N-terminal, plant-type [Sesbania bispinosa]|nr:Leucine-rich repeat-containing N-terminal, plant-type [Sesbania bispinosa]